MPALYPFSRRINMLVAALAFAAPVARAQESPSLLDLIRPERLIQHVVQSGIMALRTQVDLKYSGMSVWLGGSRIALNDLEIWPLPEWDANGDCVVRASRVVVKGSALDRADAYRADVAAYGLSAPLICLPPDVRPMAQMAGLQEIALPQAAVRIGYDIPSAAAKVSVDAVATDLAAIRAEAHFPYFWFDGRDDMEEPLPVFFLSEARVTLENLGAWERFSVLVPPPFANAEQAPLALEGLVGSMLAEANRESADDSEAGDPSALTEEQRAFVSSLAATWGAFLAAPQKLVLETDIPDGEDVFLDFEFYADDPKVIFADLRPRLATASATGTALLDLDLLQKARMGEISELSPEDLRRVGMALITGEGAPRDEGLGATILNERAKQGDGVAAMALARALKDSAPEESYRMALLAGATVQPGASDLLDRLEADLTLEGVLSLQADFSANVTHPMQALDRLPLILDEARARMTGRGQPRSYAIAAMWASLAKAAGAPEGTAILEEIDERVRFASPAARELWQGQRNDASALALQAWVEQDLPGRLGLRP
ncbi:hypothetical protein CLV78_10977 [Aliiruegeria haliotis]|uniref:Uncharacterized protein n=1 Tax=Aliiruegeria haliotis TaxID=1280846 RepID=A0A2T0RJU5_9RHOB|nr:hypothetical protein [Aliiruegeria haliotis]PRY21464.1 hypothetical protein CLV78_10977 [Aliiruegeria haliotis]